MASTGCADSLPGVTCAGYAPALDLAQFGLNTCIRRFNGEILMEDQVFEAIASKLLEEWAEIIEDAVEDADVDCDGSVLSVELDDGRVFILNRHRPLKQMWLSSPISGASHYAWDDDAQAWQGTREQGRLDALFSGDLSIALGQKITLTQPA
jgi:frataxin